MAIEVVELESIADARLDVYARLTEAQLRNKLEPQKGVFIAESFKVIDRALAAGIEPLSMLVTPKWVDAALQRLAAGGVDGIALFVGTEEMLKPLTGFNLTRGALAAMRRPALPSVADVVRDARRVAVLDGIVDHTNVGAIFRSAAALGVDAVLVTPTCCDPLYRRSVRVSMGTIFQVPWTRIGTDVHTWEANGIDTLRGLGFTAAAMALSDDSVPLGSPALHEVERLAMVFGTEGDGLSHAVIDGCDLVVRIPMMNDVDSLNVAAASAVAFWELCRR